MVIQISRTIIFVAILIICCRCNSLDPGSGSEGKIIYDINFPDIPKESMYTALLPNQVTTYFKDDKSRTTMKASIMGYGIASTYITDAEEKTVVILLDLYGKKYATVRTAQDIRPEKIPEYKIIRKKGEKTIAGQVCEVADAVDTLAKDTFSICYSKNISLQNMYWNTPFKKINAPLLEYRINQENIIMSLKASTVELTAVEDSLFIIPPGYRIITQEEYENLVNELPLL